MYRFVDLGEQLSGYKLPDEPPNRARREFALYDTCRSRFLVDKVGLMTWVNWDALVDRCEGQSPEEWNYIDLERAKSLCPPWVFDKIADEDLMG